MSELAIVPDLDVLAQTVRDEYAASRSALGSAVDHYFACGSALLEARKLLPSNEAFGDAA